MKLGKKILLNKIMVLVIILCVSMVSLNVSSIVIAVEPESVPMLQMEDAAGIDGNYLVFKNADENVIGKVGVKIDGEDGTVFTPVLESNHYLFKLSKIKEGEDSYNIHILFEPTSGYEVDGNVFISGMQDMLPGADETTGIRDYGFDITSNSQITIVDEINFNLLGQNNEPQNGQNNEPQNGPQGDIYPIVAYFEGVATAVEADENGKIMIPDNWEKGNVKFYAKTCEVDGVVTPFVDGTPADEGSEGETHLDIEGVANGGAIARTVSPAGEKGKDSYLVVKDEFTKYGKAVVHLMTSEINAIATLTTKDYIGVRAAADIEMSYSLGSVAVDNAILTNNNNGEVAIFFGNKVAKLTADGPNIKGIKKVTGGAGVTYNNDGTASIKLPDLSVETTTALTLEIELKDGKTITRNLKVARTAIMLDFSKGDGDASLKAGYVMNKAYLYNNKAHDDKVFDAYLQVILYKGGVVAGYKQVKIDDEKIINSLRDNESASMELYSEAAIDLYGTATKDTIEGVDSASVFLTNGPIDFDKELPSIEFGIGSGVTIEFGGND